jgi:hypothetical protein
VAVTREDLDRFVGHANADRSRIVVAPYRLYVSTVHGYALHRPVWCHRRADGQHVEEGEPTCAYFGFGLIYFPQALVRAFRDEWHGHFSDGSFAGWHRRHVTDAVPICWDVRPVHLHYPLAEFGTNTDPPKPPLVLTRIPDPTADERRAAGLDDRLVAALLRERAGLVRAGKVDRIAALNEQLTLRGYDDGSNDGQDG